MGDETKRTDGTRSRRSVAFVLSLDDLPNLVAEHRGSDALTGQSIIDLCAYRTAYNALACALIDGTKVNGDLRRENGNLRTSLSLLTTTERQLRDALDESRARVDRMRITMEQQTADAAALKAKVEDLTGKLAMIEAAPLGAVMIPAMMAQRKSRKGRKR